MIFDHAGNVVAVDRKEYRQIHPQPGWAEHVSLEVWQRTQEVIADELRANCDKAKEWNPAMDAEQRKKLYSGWKKAVTCTFDWVE